MVRKSFTFGDTAMTTGYQHKVRAVGASVTSEPWWLFPLITQPLYSLLAFLQVDVRLFLVSSSFCASRVALSVCLRLPLWHMWQMPLPHWKNTIIQALQSEDPTLLDVVIEFLVGGQGSLLQQGLHESEGLHGMGGGRLMLFTLSEVVRISLDGGSWEVMVVDSIKAHKEVLRPAVRPKNEAQQLEVLSLPSRIPTGTDTSSIFSKPITRCMVWRGEEEDVTLPRPQAALDDLAALLRVTKKHYGALRSKIGTDGLREGCEYFTQLLGMDPNDTMTPILRCKAWAATLKHFNILTVAIHLEPAGSQAFYQRGLLALKVVICKWTS
ncbi:hypothetical protein EMCRGX_G012140 [Ephydatia muelleri]